MAAEPTPEQNARRVLSIFEHFQSKEGDVLAANNFVAVGSRRRWNMKDLQTGLDYAFDQKWVETTDAGWIRLTKTGFEQM